MSNEELKKCPFCGGQSIKAQERISYGHGDSTCEVYIECESCHAKGPDTGYWGSPTPEQRTKAALLWNARI